MSEELLAGFAVKAIKPPLGVTMAGFAARKGGSTGTHDELRTHAMVLKSGTEWAVVVSMDLVEAPDDLVERVRNRVSAATDIPEGAILIGSTHTHSGPLVSGRFGATEESAVINQIEEATIDAILSALKGLEPAKIKIGSMEVHDIARNRRSLEPSPDPWVNFIGFYSREVLVGCLVNFPLHATVLGAENRLLTADYPGYLRSTIQKAHPDCCTLFLNGAAGNINIGYSADASALGEVFDFRTFEKATEVGEKLGAAVVEGLAMAKWTKDIALEVQNARVPLPLKKLPSVQELNSRIEQQSEAVKRLRVQGAAEGAVAKAEISKIYLECLRDSMVRRGIEGHTELAMPIQAIRIGSAVLVAIPGELFVELGLGIRQSRQDLHVFVAGYANGSWGYLPTADAFELGGYEVETSVFDENMGNALVDGASKLVALF